MAVRRRLPLGIIVPLAEPLQPVMDHVAELGLDTCQLGCWQPDRFTPALARQARQAARRAGITISSFWAGYTGPVVWDFLRGPATCGLVPAEYRPQRVRELKRGADFAADLGTPWVATHLGFVPENPADPLYRGFVSAVRRVAEHCAQHQLTFAFETGQETPTALLRLIEDLGLDNLGINLDPANLILYGKANPVDAVDILGPHIRSIHAKDGRWPTDPSKLGEEVLIGQGLVDFRAVFTRLHHRGYTGAVTIERETSGPQQIEDVRQEKIYLEKILNEVTA